MSARVTIDPITRLEGHGRIDLFLDDSGELENAYFIVPELRGFEEFCKGRAVEELAFITPRICGVCPEAHHMASMKALDAVFKVEPPPAARKLRELLYNTFYVTDHTLHFFFLASPDFVMGPDAPVAERNILGVVAKVGLELGGRVIALRKECGEVLAMLAGRQVHPVCGLPGGVSKGLNEEERKRVLEIAPRCVEFAQLALKVFDDVVLANSDYVTLIKSDIFAHRTYYMGLVDEQNRANFYDGHLRVVDPDGVEFARFRPEQYLDHIAEHVEQWTYLKFPYLKAVGWKGLVDGKESGVYRVAPLARLNASEGMSTPLAQKEYERFYEVLGGKPVHATLATHWARLIELLNAAERMVELADDPEITSTEIRRIPTATPGEGVGCVEAPRGVLIHHYVADADGITRKVNLIVGTGHNYAGICMSVKKAAQGLIRAGQEITPGVLNRIEMAFRAYDPCFACATHSVFGQMPLEVRVFDKQGRLLDTVARKLE